MRRPELFSLSAELDEFRIRNRSADGGLHPHIAFEIAVRTTEHLGVKAAAAGVSCWWNIGRLGPWNGFIPTPVGPIPVYAVIP